MNVFILVLGKPTFYGDW